MQVILNQLASRLLESRASRFQLVAVPQKHLAGHTDKFFDRFNGLPLDIDQRPLAKRISSPLGVLKDTLASRQLSGDVLRGCDHLMNDFELVPENGKGLLELVVKPSEFNPMLLLVVVTQRLAPPLVRRCSPLF